MSSSIERAIQPHRFQTVDALRRLAAVAGFATLTGAVAATIAVGYLG